MNADFYIHNIQNIENVSMHVRRKQKLAFLMEHLQLLAEDFF